MKTEKTKEIANQIYDIFSKFDNFVKIELSFLLTSERLPSKHGLPEEIYNSLIDYRRATVEINEVHETVDFSFNGSAPLKWKYEDFLKDQTIKKIIEKVLYNNFSI
jgi:hypothetical protein